MTKHIWKQIIKNKALDLPDYREMVTNHRCNEIKENAYKHIEAELKTLISESSEKENANLKDQVENVLKKAIDRYTLNTRYYDKVIQEIHKVLLEKELS